MSKQLDARWTEAEALRWQASLERFGGWLVGCNFIPSTAINQLEMWQAETFDPATIDRELGWARGVGLNTVRVYLHDLLWEQDASGFCDRFERFLSLAEGHGMAVIVVLFDDCRTGESCLGPQPAPRPGIHNAGWVQSPAASVKARWNEADRARCGRYVREVIGRFGGDPRIVLWDLYNEPGHCRAGMNLSDEARDVQALRVLEDVVAWAREARPTQPITVGVWRRFDQLDTDPLNHRQLAVSDVPSFHSYTAAEGLPAFLVKMQRDRRPLICTEYMARTRPGNGFRDMLPLLRRHRIGAIHWGLVAGKTQTHYPWNSPGGSAPPPVWHHDLLHADGTPYDPEEVRFIRQITQPPVSAPADATMS